jgi:hypothetical protein
MWHAWGRTEMHTGFWEGNLNKGDFEFLVLDGGKI